MADPSNTSFIPKRNPVKKVRGASTRPVFIGTLLVRAFFFAVLIATIVVFVYDNRLDSQLDKEITKLNNSIPSFSEVDMQKVLDMDLRLKQANNRLKYTASIKSIFEALELATIQTVQVERMDVIRSAETEFEVIAKMKTGTFDSIMFQRGVLERSDTLVVNSVDELVLSNGTDSSGRVDDIEFIDFKANLSILTESIPHSANNENDFRTVPVVPVNSSFVPATEGVDNTEAGNNAVSDEGNQDDI